MAWALDIQNSQWVHTGTNREVVLSAKAEVTPLEPQPMISGMGSYRLVMAVASDASAVTLRMAESTHRRIEAGVYTGAFLNAIDAGARGATDLYAAVLRVDWQIGTTAANAHAIRKESTGTLVAGGQIAANAARDIAVEARLVEDTIEVFVNGRTATAAYAFVEADWPDYRFFGFASSVNGAVVKNPQVCSLDPVRHPAGETVCIDSNGELYISEAGEIPVRVGTISHGGDTQVCAAEYDGWLYVTDGQWIRVFKPLTREIVLYGPANGDNFWTVAVNGFPPGAADFPGDPTKKQIGVTTATILCAHLNRLWFLGMPESPRDYWATRIGDAHDLFIGATDSGRAFQGQLELQAGVPVSPFTGMWSASDDYAIFGCQQEIMVLRGDPILSDGHLDVVTKDAGIIGPDAAWVGNGAVVHCLTQQGHAVIQGAQITFVSRPVLMRGIAKGSDWANWRSKVIHDPERNGVLLFFTSVESADDPTHFWHALNTGGYFPETYDSGFGPTAVGRVNNMVYVGSQQGYVYIYDESLGFDRWQSNSFGYIHSQVPLTLLQWPDTEFAIRVRNTTLTLSSASGQVDIWWFGGRTAEDAYFNPEQRVGARARAGRNSYRQRVRGGAVVVYLDHPTGYGTGAPWSVDAVDVDADPAGMNRFYAGFAFPSGSSGSGAPSGSGSGTTGFGSGGTGTGSGSGVDPLSGSGPPTGFIPSTSGSGGDPSGTFDPPIGEPSGSGTGAGGEGWVPVGSGPTVSGSIGVGIGDDF